MSTPVRRIISRKEQGAGGIYDLSCGHSVYVTGDAWDECVAWEYPCAKCGGLEGSARQARDRNADTAEAGL